MPTTFTPRPAYRTTLRTAVTALRLWTARRWMVAVVATFSVAVLIGVPTVLIPNSLFGRDIPTEPWNYPVWLLVSVLTGLLIATYVRANGPPTRRAGERGGDGAGEERSRRLGMSGAILTWFAVGCPVCNKLALLAFGYSGAITWFAPAQPYLAAAAIVLSVVALVRRLQGEVSCALPTVEEPTP